MRRFFDISAIAIVLAIIIFLVEATTAYRADASRKVSCAAFPTQYLAQLAFNLNPIKYKALDKDHDGKACEYLP